MKFSCSHCRQRFDVPEHWKGRTIECTHCGESILVPSQSEDPVLSETDDSSPSVGETLPPRDTTPPRETPPSPTPPPRPVPSAPATPPLPSRPQGLPLAFVLPVYTLLLGLITFGYVALRNQESPRQTWQRFASLISTPPSPITAPESSPAPSPVSEPVAAATPALTPSPTVTPTPADTLARTPDPLDWLANHKNRWPKEVKLLEAQDFPAIFNDKVVGSVSVPAGSAVAVIEIAPGEIVVASPGGSPKRLPAKATSLPELARLEMARPEPPPPTPTPAPRTAEVVPPPTPSATPIPTPETTPPAAKRAPVMTYFGTTGDLPAEETDADSTDKNPAPDRTLTFSTDAPGVDKSIKTWGMGTVGGPGVMQSGLDNMGLNRIDVVIMPFPVKDPLTERGELSAASKALIDADLATAKLAGNKPLILSAGVGGPDPIHPWYLQGPNKVNAARWADCMVATARYINRPIAWAQAFNEPDYGPWGEGSKQDLNAILDRLRGESVFRSTKLAGPAVLNVDWGLDWYNAIKGRVSIGTTHALNGSCESYIRFLTAVKNDGYISFCPELHNVGEAIVGAEYGLGGGIWWLGCGPERGAFVKASGGKRLGYAEDRERWSAAAVYRTPGGDVQAFLGTSERNAQTTTYRFVCKDREVYFDGKGPSKEHTVTIERGQEKAIKVTWSH